MTSKARFSIHTNCAGDVTKLKKVLYFFYFFICKKKKTGLKN